MAAIAGVEIEIDSEAVVVTAADPLMVLSSAVVGGGLGYARAIVNLHVHKHYPWGDAELRLDAFAARRLLPAPRVGLLTAAWTERAEVAVESAAGLSALVVTTVGLGNVVAAGWSPAAATPPGTINTIVIVDADVEPAALVNLALTVTEVKTLVLGAAGLTAARSATPGGSSPARPAVRWPTASAPGCKSADDAQTLAVARALAGDSRGARDRRAGRHQRRHAARPLHRSRPRSVRDGRWSDGGAAWAR
jgi:adenosylcobinamide amidohydrolase